MASLYTLHSSHTIKHQRTPNKGSDKKITKKVSESEKEENASLWTSISSWFGVADVKEDNAPYVPSKQYKHKTPSKQKTRGIYPNTPITQEGNIKPGKDNRHNVKKASSWSQESPMKKLLKKNKKSGRDPMKNSEHNKKEQYWDDNEGITFWKDMIIPKFDMFRTSPFLLKMWRKHGIPEGVRGEVWEASIGNAQNLQFSYLTDLLEKASAIVQVQHEQTNDSPLTMIMNFERPRVSSIDNDVRRTLQMEFDALSDSEGDDKPQDENKNVDSSLDDLYSSLDNSLSDATDSTNSDKSPGIKANLRSGALLLSELLQAFALHTPSLSYIQGMTYLGAMLLRTMPSRQSSLCALIHLVDSPFLRDFYYVNATNIRQKFALFDCLMEDNLPILHRRFKSMKLSCDVFLMEWWISLFASVIPVDLAIKVWDGYLIEGETYLYRFAVALLAFMSPALTKLQVGESIQLLRSCQGSSHVSFAEKHSRKLFEQVKMVKFSEGLRVQVQEASKNKR